jgi:hypothetical protein
MPAVGGSAEIAFVTVHAEAVVQAGPAQFDRTASGPRMGVRPHCASLLNPTGPVRRFAPMPGRVLGRAGASPRRTVQP